MSDAPHSVSRTLVLAADWADPASWQVPLMSFVRAFSAHDDVRLILPFEPRFDGEALAAQIDRLAASAGLDLERGADLVLAPITGTEDHLHLAAGALALLLAPGREAPAWTNGLPIRIRPIASPDDLADLIRPAEREDAFGEEELLDQIRALSAGDREQLQAFLGLLADFC